MADDPIAPEQLEQALAPALERLVLTLADSKRLMGIRYSDWLLGAPSIEAGIATSSMAQDEWGHARLLYAMLKGLGRDPVEVEHERPAEEYRSLDALDRPFEDWAGVVAGMIFVDGAIRVALGGFAAGRFEPARSRVPKMLSEEEFHASLGAAWFRRLAGAGGEARKRLVAAVEGTVPAALAWLGNEDAAARSLADAGLMRGGDELVEEYRSATREPLALVGLDAGAIEPAPGWDEARARGPGHPDEESVQRARGDLNRALFVE